MKVIEAQNVNQAYVAGLAHVRKDGVLEESRAGPVLVVPTPVMTVYERPQERVLFDPGRNANPFFHFFESLHMLAGRSDARWLDRFVRDFSSRFAEEDGHQHGAYGFRWRRHFDVEGGGHPALPDQLETVVGLLRADPKDRRVVVTMWDPAADLGAQKNDIPCNTHIYPRVRVAPDPAPAADWYSDGSETRAVLDLTVCCRSNDVVWGCYGANSVHFSVLQEYLAGRLGVGVGRLYHLSNNFHGYTRILEKVGAPEEPRPYPGSTPMGQDWEHWDEDLARFMGWTESQEPLENRVPDYTNSWFRDTADPLYCAHWCWKRGFHHDAYTILGNAEDAAPDWRLAAQEWFGRRKK